jgi:hypothetical protein
VNTTTTSGSEKREEAVVEVDLLIKDDGDLNSKYDELDRGLFGVGAA